MDDILQALAKMLNMTVDEVSSLLTTFKGNAPQIYEQLTREWTYYTVLSKATVSMLFIGFLLTIVTGIVRFNLEVGYDFVNQKEVPDIMTRVQYARLLTKENVKNASKTFKMLYASISASVVLALVFNISKYLLAPNYSFLLNEVLPKLTNR